MASQVEPVSARGAFAVTKSDTTVFVRVTSGIYVGGLGDVAVTMESGEAVTFVGVPAGTILPVRATQVLSTGTSATNIVALVY